MCGICGAIGTPDPKLFTALVMLNRERGTGGCGLTNGREIIKSGLDPATHILGIPAEFFRSRILLGHTRKPTHGAVDTENSHPFTYGRITGAHNGVISNFEELKKKHPKIGKAVVDSEAIMYLLSKFGIKSMENLRGSYAVWFLNNDTPERVFLFRNYGSPLHYAVVDGTTYFSSESAHLKIVLPEAEDHFLPAGTLMSIHSVTGEVQKREFDYYKESTSRQAGFTFGYSDSDYIGGRRAYDRTCCDDTDEWDYRCPSCHLELGFSIAKRYNFICQNCNERMELIGSPVLAPDQITHFCEQCGEEFDEFAAERYTKCPTCGGKIREFHPTIVIPDDYYCYTCKETFGSGFDSEEHEIVCPLCKERNIDLIDEIVVSCASCGDDCFPEPFSPHIDVLCDSCMKGMVSQGLASESAQQVQAMIDNSGSSVRDFIHRLRGRFIGLQ